MSLVLSDSYYTPGAGVYSRQNLKRVWKVGQSTGRALRESYRRTRQKLNDAAEEVPPKKDKKKDMPKGTGNGNVIAQKSLVSRSSMSVSGKTKVKRVTSVNVLTRLRKQIKQVMSGNAALGTYVTIKSGFVGSLVGPGISANIFNGDDLNKTQVGVLYNAASQLPGRTLFNNLVNFAPGVASTIVAGTGLNFFTPGKIIDAVSVLFNNKQASPNSYLVTDNLSSFSLAASAAPAIVPGNLKINVKNSSVQFTMKNVSNRVVSVDIWEMTPMLKFQNSNPLQDMFATLSAYSEITSDTNFQYISGGINSLNSFFDPTIEAPSIAKQHMGFKFNWKKRSMVLAPDETCIHSIVGPKGVFDFKNIFQTAATLTSAQPLSNPDCLFKGWSVGCVISVCGDLVLPIAASTGGRFTYTTVNGGLGMPIAVEVKERYSISVPEVAGFLTTDGIAMSRQQLNLRKPKTIIYNQASIGHVAYTVSNEVNPLADVAGTQNS